MKDPCEGCTFAPFNIDSMSCVQCNNFYTKVEAMDTCNEKQKVTDITDGMPQKIAELICLACHYRAINVWPASMPMKTLVCDECKQVGLMINTGEMIDDE